MATKKCPIKKKNSEHKYQRIIKTYKLHYKNRIRIRLLLISVYTILLNTSFQTLKTTLLTKSKQNYTNLNLYIITLLLRTLFIPTTRLGIFLLKHKYIIHINKINFDKIAQIQITKIYDYVTIPTYFQQILLKFKQYTNITQRIFQKKKT